VDPTLQGTGSPDTQCSIVEIKSARNLDRRLPAPVALPSLELGITKESTHGDPC